MTLLQLTCVIILFQAGKLFSVFCSLHSATCCLKLILGHFYRELLYCYKFHVHQELFFLFFLKLYFPHDSNAKDDPKCMVLIDQLGMEGYGIYWVLIELRDTTDASLATPETIIARQTAFLLNDGILICGD